MLRQGEILCDGCSGFLSISGVDLVGGDPRWCAYNLEPLKSDKPMRGTNVDIAGIPGALAFVHRPAQMRYLLPFAVTGWFDTTGAPVDPDDVEAEMDAAFLEIEAAIIGPPSPITLRGTRPAIWDRPSGVTEYADVQTIMFRERRTVAGLWVGDLELIIPTPWQVAS